MFLIKLDIYTVGPLQECRISNVIFGRTDPHHQLQRKLTLSSQLVLGRSRLDTKGELVIFTR
jgi:hypothetical protein